MKTRNLKTKTLSILLAMVMLLGMLPTTALAASPSDYNCTQCGNPCTAWFPTYDSGKDAHVPLCSDCYSAMWDKLVYCTPVAGSATCLAPDLCSVCGFPAYMNSQSDPNAHSYGDWEYASPTQHRRYCTICDTPESYEYEDHYGGTASCISSAVCEVCNAEYGPTNDAHSFIEWIPYSGTQHYRYCSACGRGTEYEGHVGDGTCLSQCKVCGEEFTDPNGTHGDVDYYSLNDAQHRGDCTRCNQLLVSEDHYGGTATCTEQAICEACGQPYGDALDHAPGAEATCTTDQICTRNGCGEVLVEKLGHDWGEWVQSGEQYARKHTRTCSRDADHTETDYCSGGTATCVAAAECTTCYGSYGGLGSHIQGPYYQHPIYDLCHAWDCQFEGCDYSGFGNHEGDNTLCTEQYCTTPGCGLPFSNGHDWDWNNAVAHNDASCYSSGTQTIPCSRCDEGSMTIANSNDPQKETHEYLDYFPHNMATCTANATEIAKCTWYNGVECSATNTREISDSALGHIPGAAATCTTNQVCTRNGCGVVLTEKLGHDWGDWVKSGEQHTRACSRDAAHTETSYCSGGTATCTEKAKCTVCGTEYGNLADHTYGTEWKSDGTNHWHECSCGAKSGEAAHSGGTATCKDKAVCSTCGTAYGELAAHTYENGKCAVCEVADPNYVPETDSPQTGDNSHMALWIALLFISGGAVITLTVYDRKRKTANR